MNVTQSILIQQSPKEVYNYLMDVENRKEFIPSLQEVILLDSLPLKAGSRYIEVATIAGKSIRTTYEITRLSEGLQISARTIKSIFPIQSNLNLVDQGNSTLLTIELAFTLSGLFRIASGLIKNIVSEQAITILEKVKYNLEN